MDRAANLPLGADHRVLKLLSNPFRYKVFCKLGERPWSATQLEPVLGESWERIREEIRLLHKEGLAEPVGAEAGPRGGRIILYRAERFYFTAEEWEEFPPETREAGSYTVLQLLFGEALQALSNGALESRSDRVLIREPLWTDDEGAKKIEEIMVRARTEVAAAAEESHCRLAASNEKPVSLLTGFLSVPTAESGGAISPP